VSHPTNRRSCAIFWPEKGSQSLIIFRIPQIWLQQISGCSQKLSWLYCRLLCKGWSSPPLIRTYINTYISWLWKETIMTPSRTSKGNVAQF
jgi:hypothetical protein